MKQEAVFIGYGQGEWEHQRNNWPHQPDLIAANLLEAVQSIIGADVRHTPVLPREGCS